ncbi:MAG: molybdopterin-dependent oxidoreductase [Kiritimatiellae bacterium]|nr:molybdopterin-dependent oxidoreductase [Kiritimatiellia bacterium]
MAAERWVNATCYHNCGGGSCPLRVRVLDGRIVEVRADDTGEDSPAAPQMRACNRGLCLKDELFSPARIRHPMKRKHWQPDGGARDLRGRDEWVWIDWAEALDLAAREFARVKACYGNEAILELGNQLAPFINRFGGAARVWGSTSQGTWKHSAALVGLGDGGGHAGQNDRMDWRNVDQFVLWGVNPAWSAHGNTMYFLREAKRRGARFIVIDPYYNDSVMVLADDWVPVRPGTDHALALGLAHVLISEDDPESNPLLDRDFLRRCTVGFDAESMPAGADPSENFRDYVLGVHDRTPKSPAWAAAICGTAPAKIRETALALARTKRTALLTGWAPARVHNADSWPQMFRTLGCMLGHVGEPGRMTALCVHGGAGSGGRPLWGRPRPASGPGVSPVRVQINRNEVWDAVLGAEYTVGPDRKEKANIRMLVHDGASALNQFPGLLKGVAAHRAVEFVLTQNIVFNPNAAYSDLVLPATTAWERDGGLKGRREYVFWTEPVLPPQHEARDDAWIARELARRLHIDPDGIESVSWRERAAAEVRGAWVLKADGTTREPLFSVTAEDWVELGVQGAPQEGRFPFRDLRRGAVYRIPRAPGDAFTDIAFSDFRRDPARHPLKTPSGRFEIYCRGLADWVAAKGYSAIRPIPAYQPPVEGYEDTFSAWPARRNGAYPLQLVSLHHIGRTHSSLHEIAWLQDQFPQLLLMNPLDAAARGLADGDGVVVESRHGRLRRPVRVTVRVMPGVVVMGEGAWVDFDEEAGLDRAGSGNVLNGAIPTGQGHAGWNSCNVQVSKASGAKDGDGP